MLLVVDVGNTQTHLGLFSDDGLVASWRFATEREKTGDELAVMVDALLRLDGYSREALTGFAVASVVPRLNGEYASLAVVEAGPGAARRRARRQDRHAHPHQ